MRFLMIHVDSFRCTITARGRARLVEPPEPRERAIGEGLLVWVSVEKGDETDPTGVARKAAAEIAANARNLGVRTIMIHPFAHLFAEPSDPETAVTVMKTVAEALAGEGFEVFRSPFGWFNAWEIRAKGHPYSRVARIVRPDLPPP